MNKLNILMFGPHLKATSGISNVINNWIESGINKHINLYYISTLRHYVPGKYINKVVNAFTAYSIFIIKSFGNVDIVHVHMSSNMSFFRKWFIFKWSKIRKIKTILHLHGSEFKEFYYKSGNFAKRMIANIFDNVDGIFVLSESWKSFISSISNNKNIFIVYNGASIEKFSGKETNGKKINVTFMGRLGERKGVYDLLSAFEKIIPVMPNVHLILGGDGDVERVKTWVFKNNFQNQIHVLGWVSGEDKIRVFRECDIYVLPSYNEGLPGSVLEAMAVGVPVISTPVGGIPEAVLDGENGFLVNPGDVDNLSEKIMLLCKNKSLRNKMGNKSRNIIIQKFNMNNIILDIIKYYNQVA